MTWSITHTIPYNTTADYGTFFTYMWDTYLAGKGWTVGAGSDAFEREVSYSVTNAWTSTSEVRHWRVDWTSGTSANCNMYNYVDYTGNTTNASMFHYLPLNGSQTEFQFWTSTADANAAMITGGRSQFVFFWPGDSAKWFLRGDDEGGAAGEKAYIGPMTGFAWKQFGYQADPADTTAANRYQTNGYIGFNGEDIGSGVNPPVPVGAKFIRVRKPILGVGDGAALAGDNTKFYNTRGPIVQLTASDLFLQFGCTTSSRDARLYDPDAVGFDGTNYFYGSSSTSNTLVFEFGPSEPAF